MAGRELRDDGGGDGLGGDAVRDVSGGGGGKEGFECLFGVAGGLWSRGEGLGAAPVVEGMGVCCEGEGCGWDIGGGRGHVDRPDAYLIVLIARVA